MNEFRINVYGNARFYKERTKELHDKCIVRRELKGANELFYTILLFDYFPVSYIQDGQDRS